MFRIAVCDDHVQICTEIETIIRDSKKLKSYDIEIDIFHSGESLLGYIERNHNFDLLLLDIELQLMNGVEVGRKIREDQKDEITQILYISSKQSYAMELFDNRPLSFLIKPIDKDKLIHLIYTLSISVGSIIIIILAYLSDYSDKSTLAIVSVLLYINIMVFYLYDVVNKYYSNLLEIQLLEKQNSIYKNQIDIISDTQKEIKIMKHDMKNHMLSFVSMLKKEQTFKALDYVYNILDSINASGNFVDTGNTEIDSLLNYKILEAKKNQISVNTSIIIPDKLNIKSLDISAIIGNLIDNSIEAVKKCDDKKIDISIELERGILYITIKNPYKGKIKKKTADI